MRKARGLSDKEGELARRKEGKKEEKKEGRGGKLGEGGAVT